jgi:transposase-like protein
MPRGIPSLTQEQKEEILRRVKENGERVPDLSKEYGVALKPIYNMLRNGATQPNTVLELARLKREHESLLKIIGQLVADQKMGKKT